MKGKEGRWITTKNNQRVFIDKSGKVVAGMGGKFNGQEIDNLEEGKTPEKLSKTQYRKVDEKNTAEQSVQGTLGSLAANRPRMQEAYYLTAARTERRSDAGGGEQPRGIRNNNPGNVHPTDDPNDPWVGETGRDDEFSVFDTPHHGLRAMARTLDTYRNRLAEEP